MPHCLSLFCGENVDLPITVTLVVVDFLGKSHHSDVIKSTVAENNGNRLCFASFFACLSKKEKYVLIFFIFSCSFSHTRKTEKKLL